MATAVLQRTHVAESRVVLCCLILVLNLQDVALTRRLLDLGAVEANPIAQWFLGNGMLEPVKVLCPLALAVLMPFAPPRRWIGVALWGVVAVYAAVVAINVVNLSLV